LNEEVPDIPMAVEDSGELEPSTIVDETVVSVAVAETKIGYRSS